jgi:pimeloyl-ACP methyl ester carboxylesterase
MGELPPIRFVTAADGVRIAYCRHGSGPPLVFVRGWVTHLELSWEEDDYRAFFERLATRFHVVRFDARGNGRSDWDVDCVDLDRLTSDLEAVMDGLDLRDAVLWGSHFGAPIAVTYAARHPERVSRLILDGAYATVRGLGTPERRESFRAMLAAMRAQPDAINASFIYMADPDSKVPIARRVDEVRRSIKPEVLVQLYELAADYDVSDLLPAIRVPTLVLHRHGNRAIPVRLGRAMAALIPDAQFVALDGTVATLWRERADDALAVVGEFLGVDLRPPERADPTTEPPAPRSPRSPLGPVGAPRRPAFRCRACFEEFDTPEAAAGRCLYAAGGRHELYPLR